MRAARFVSPGVTDTRNVPLPYPHAPSRNSCGTVVALTLASVRSNSDTPAAHPYPAAAVYV